MTTSETDRTPDQPASLAQGESGPGPTPQPDPGSPKAGLERLRVRKTTVASFEGGGPTQTVETSTKAGLNKERQSAAKAPRAGREGE